MAATPGWHRRDFPERIVCLVEEPTEILYQLGESHRIVGISAYTVRPPEARHEKPVVSAFIGGSLKKIQALAPDLIIGFSDVQADLARDLIKNHQQVLVFNQRSVQDILDVVIALGNLVGQRQRARELVDSYVRRLDAARERARTLPYRPKVYFEEWPDPTISAIRWIGELIEVAGGQDIFADRRAGRAATERFVEHEMVAARQPDVIIGSWCGKPLDPRAIKARPGYAQTPAVQHDRVYELDAAIILQPGPAALTDGLDALEAIIHAAARPQP